MSPTNTWDLGLLVIPLMAGQVNMSWLSTSAHYRFSSGTSLTTSYSGLSLTVEVTYDGEVGRLEYTYDANGRLVSFFFFLDGEIEHYVIDQSLCLAVNSPEDIEYAEGETGNIITWIPTGVDLIDPTYSIMRGTRVVKTGTWTSGRAISIDVDDLLEGDYSYQIILADGLGAEISDSVDVLVLEPEADSPFSVPGFSLPLLMAGSVIGLVWCARRRNNLHD
jgi:YD repeat-containing protein